MNADAAAGPRDPSAAAQDGVDMRDAPFTATPLPVIARSLGSATAGQPAGVALAFAGGAAGRASHEAGDEAGDGAADEASDAAPGEDRFALCVVDAQGEVLIRLGSFTEEEIVARWRDFAAKSGLPRMVLREDGGLGIVSRQLGRVLLGTSRQRRRHGLLNDRRPRFLVRRKPARLPARPRVYRGENEIIART